MTAVAHHDDVEVDPGLRKQASQPQLEILGPVALGEHDGAELRPVGHDARTRFEVTIATKCPATESSASGTRTASSRRVPARSPRTASTIATGRMISVSSIEW